MQIKKNKYKFIFINSKICVNYFNDKQSAIYLILNFRFTVYMYMVYYYN